MGKDDATPNSNEDAPKGNEPVETPNPPAQADIKSEATTRMEVKAEITSEGSIFNAPPTESQGKEESE